VWLLPVKRKINFDEGKNSPTKKTKRNDVENFDQGKNSPIKKTKSIDDEKNSPAKKGKKKSKLLQELGKDTLLCFIIIQKVLFLMKLFSGPDDKTNDILAVHLYKVMKNEASLEVKDGKVCTLFSHNKSFLSGTHFYYCFYVHYNKINSYLLLFLGSNW
jgi:hypothetical protein